ncbi:MAG: T9SS type A sorting domain-containing protein [Ignavibacteria bacterium]|nr:T9SS type A sorting domain-containing protein [Ignavibacteria bacterium]
MNTKNILITVILLIVFSSVTNEAQQWVKMNPTFDPPGDYNLGRGVMLDKNNGWVVEELNRKAFQTTDGGYTWNLKLQVDTTSVGEIFFLNSDNGWITFAQQDSTILFRTEDGGMIWDRFTVPFMYRVFFVNDTLGFGGGRLNFYKTTDGGINWSKIDLGETKYYFFFGDSYVFDENSFIILSSIWNGDSYQPRYQFAMLKTTNGGNSWFQVQTNLDGIIDFVPRNIKFFNSFNGVLTRGWVTGEAYYTNNGGLNWFKSQQFPRQNLGEITDMFFLNEQLGWVIGQSGIFLMTSDKGITWEQINITENRLYSISFIKDKSLGFIFGSHNTILKYDRTVGIKEEYTSQNSNFLLLQNYPNPFNSTTTFTFELPLPGYTELKIYDALGREVKTLLKGNVEQGKHTIQFNASDISSGIYFGVLSYDEKRVSSKIIIIK